MTVQRGSMERQDQSYEEILQLDALLKVARVHDHEVDKALFIATHQSCEIWFAVVLRHLEAVMEALERGNAPRAVLLLRRLPLIFGVLVRQFDVLGALGPDEFEVIRDDLGSASGFQSVQWREVEFVCGLRDERYIGTPGFTEADRERLRARSKQVSVSQAFLDFASAREAGGVTDDGVRSVRAALLETDEAVMTWRARHAVLAEGYLGGKRGTIGSEGAAYLWRAARRRLFDPVWPDGGAEPGNLASAN